MGTTGWGPDHPARHADAAAVTELDLSLAAAVDVPLVEQNRSEGVRQLGNERDPGILENRRLDCRSDGRGAWPRWEAQGNRAIWLSVGAVLPTDAGLVWAVSRDSEPRRWRPRGGARAEKCA